MTDEALSAREFARPRSRPASPPWSDGRDARLIERLRAGDEQALADLFHACGRRAFGLAYQMLGDGAEAEDVVQDAFVALWRHAPRLERDGNAQALLLTIVHRRSIDRLRARRARPRGALPDDIVDEHAAALLEEAIAAEGIAALVDRLRGSLGRLPEAQRVAVELAYFEGLTHREIAERVGVPLGTVKSRLRLALEHLRRHVVDADGRGPGDGQTGEVVERARSVLRDGERT